MEKACLVCVHVCEKEKERKDKRKEKNEETRALGKERRTGSLHSGFSSLFDKTAA